MVDTILISTKVVLGAQLTLTTSTSNVTDLTVAGGGVLDVLGGDLKLETLILSDNSTIYVKYVANMTVYNSFTWGGSSVLEGSAQNIFLKSSCVSFVTASNLPHSQFFLNFF
jgi:hypothetical protein